MLRKPLLILLCSCAALGGQAAEGGPAFSLAALEAQALRGNPALLASREQVTAAGHAVRVATAFPNPEIEYLTGQTRARTPGGTPGDARSVALTQPLDLPWRRQPRIALAEAARDSVAASSRAFEAEVLARVRLRYYELLRREAEQKNAQEDVALTDSVRSRIALRVDTGEAPRFELIKADAESLNAQKAAQMSAFRVAQARLLLRQAVGGGLPEDFSLSGRLSEVPELASPEQLRRELRERSPDLAQARAELVRAERQLALERAQRWPSVALKASRDTDPDVTADKVGVVLSVPLWDRRTGAVREAAALATRARYHLDDRAYSLEQALDAALQQYEIARTQVTALESGIVRQAESALRVAEAAYRFGERGFIEVLDAQRVYRAARSELIAARYELASAWIEIERLRAQSGEEQQ